jgi:hypothetical protein
MPHTIAHLGVNVRKDVCCHSILKCDGSSVTTVYRHADRLADSLEDFINVTVML